MRKRTVYFVPDASIYKSMRRVIGADWDDILASDFADEFISASSFQDLGLFDGEDGEYSSIDDTVSIEVDFQRGFLIVTSDERNTRIDIVSRKDIDEDIIEYSIKGILSSPELLEEFTESLQEEDTNAGKSPSPTKPYFASPAHTNSPSSKGWTRD